MTKKVEKNKYTNQNIDEEVLNDLIEDDKKKAEEEKSKKVKEFNYKYQYLPFSKEYTYSYDNFSETSINNNNPASITNYEKVAFNKERLIVPKVMMQYIGTLESVYLAEISRFSLYKPVNKYGFFNAYKQEIEDDIGITARQQDRICKKLVDMGFITTVTYKKEKRKFYRFNDDATLELFWTAVKKTYKRVKYRD